MNNLKYSFDAIKIRDEIIEWLQNFKETSGLSKVVIGISGGKDSSIVAALCARAFGKENVYGLLMPNGEQSDIADSHKLCDALGINYKIKNIGPVYDAAIAMLESDGNIISVEAKINIAPRLRMTTLYATIASHKFPVPITR